MRRLSDERGVVAVIVLLCTMSLFAIGAIVVDVAALYQEKRVLQNGADAAALAIAQQCGVGKCGDPAATADEYADANADDNSSAVVELCGSGVDDVDDCDDRPSLPDGAGYVRVTAATETTDGLNQVAYTFARVFGLTGSSVRARATVAWGGPKSLASELPLTISQCSYDGYLENVTELPPPPPYESGWQTEIAIRVPIDSKDKAPCPGDPTLPGGFGFLKTADLNDCTTESSIDGTYPSSTGEAVSKVCDDDVLRYLVNSVIRVPIFDEEFGEGKNGSYGMSSFAAFYLTGYRLSANPQYQYPSDHEGALCAPNETNLCIYGFFVQDDTTVEGEIGGPSTGVTVVAFVE